MTTKDKLKKEYFDLMRRSVQLGAQFPHPDDVDLNDPKAVASVMVLLRESEKVKDEMAKLTKRIARLPRC
jgi:hypothetical protein